LCAKHNVKRISRDGFTDLKPVIDQPLIKEKARARDGLEGRVVEAVYLVEDPGATVKVLETRLIKLFAEKRNLVTGCSGREDRMNCNSLAASFDTQARVNEEDFHGLTGEQKSERCLTVL